MSIQNILDSSPIAQWLRTELIADIDPGATGHPSTKVIGYDADRGSHPHSVAANIVSSILFTADECQAIEICLRRNRYGWEICFDKRPDGQLTGEVGEAAMRRVLFLAGFMDYPPKPAPHQVRVRVRGQMQVWECRRRQDSVELRRLS